MGGAAEQTYNKAKETVNAVTDAAGNVILDQAGNAVNSATGSAIKPIQKAGANFIVKPAEQTANAIGTAANQVSNAATTAYNQTDAALNKAGNQTMNFIDTAYDQGKALVNKIVDIPDMFKKPNMGGVRQAADGVGITDVTGRRKKRRGSTDVRSGLAATMLAKPQNLLGNAGGISSNQGKAKLGQ